MWIPVACEHYGSGSVSLALSNERSSQITSPVRYQSQATEVHKRKQREVALTLPLSFLTCYQSHQTLTVNPLPDVTRRDPIGPTISGSV